MPVTEPTGTATPLPTMGEPEPGPVTPEPGVTPEPETPAAECTDIAPDDRETCATWASFGECPNAWLADFCDASCGRCVSEGGTGGMPSTEPEPVTPQPEPETPMEDDTSYPPIQNGQNGHATRYWDCCKPHCGWEGNTEPYGVSTLASCDQGDNSMGSNYEAANSCTGGNAYMCHSMSPWAVNSNVAYGYAAVQGTGDICGKCYQIQFTGNGQYGADLGAAALSGKTMIVQATNIGSVNPGQFDILIPGGGVGDFDGCTQQWGTTDIGNRHGGLLAACKDQHGFEADLATYKQCVLDRCQGLFGSEFPELMEGCTWFVEWFQVADNPQLVYQEVPCPEAIMSHSGVRR
jgi:hypothetical protein